MSSRSISASAGTQPDSTKVRILKAAEQVFAQRGFEGASTREIAGRASVNISSLHYHWDSKETLYVAVFRDVVARIEVHLRRAIPAIRHAASDRHAIIDGVMGSLFDFLDAQPSAPRLLLRCIVDDGDDGVGIERDVLLPAWDVFSEWIGQADGTLDDRQARLFMLTVHSTVLVYLLDSPAYRTLLGGSVRTPTLRAAVRTHVIELVNGLMDGLAPPRP